MQTESPQKTARYASSASAQEPCRKFLETLSSVFYIRAVKSYRVENSVPAGIPVIPCLDHEAKLHARIPAHVSAYIEDKSSGDVHEVGFYPARSKLVLDTVSTHGEHSDASQDRLRTFLADRFEDLQVQLCGPSYIRGDERAAQAARAQVTLREVLTGEDHENTAREISRLKAVASLMEKESRVASWGVRTATVPILGVVGFLIVLALNAMGWSQWVYYATLTPLGAALLYVGLKAVHLTEVSNRVWKRGAEYELILAERRRLRKPD